MATQVNRKDVTPYQDINALLWSVSNGVHEILNDDLIGFYLFGPLTYGDFSQGSSDIDLVAIVAQPLNEHELLLIKSVHRAIELHYPKWRDRLECSYTPLGMLANTLPPKEPRPYYGGGVF